MPIFFIFQSTSKTATSAQNFDYKKAYFGSTKVTIGHKKFQRFQKWGQILSKTSTSYIELTLLPRAADSPCGLVSSFYQELNIALPEEFWWENSNGVRVIATCSPRNVFFGGRIQVA